MTKNLAQLRLVDEAAYDGMIKTYRLAGFFRYIQRQSPSLWRQFVRSLPPSEKKETYTILCPRCKQQEVKDWLECIESYFPSTRGVAMQQ
jgi:hypothetical protein